jgi:hypothetical protein
MFKGAKFFLSSLSEHNVRVYASLLPSLAYVPAVIFSYKIGVLDEKTCKFLMVSALNRLWGVR